MKKKNLQKLELKRIKIAHVNTNSMKKIIGGDFVSDFFNCHGWGEDKTANTSYQTETCTNGGGETSKTYNGI